MNSTVMKLSVRISDLDWARLISEWAMIRAILKNTLEDLSRDERKAIRKLIESLLKGGEELEEVRGAGHAAANGMMQQVVVILEGLDKPEPVATGWVKDFDSAKEKVISHLVEGLSGYLNADNSEKESEADTEGPDSTAAGMGDSLQGEPPQGEASAESTAWALSSRRRFLSGSLASPWSAFCPVRAAAAAALCFPLPTPCFSRRLLLRRPCSLAPRAAARWARTH
jgi:hypothetical protein